MDKYRKLKEILEKVLNEILKAHTQKEVKIVETHDIIMKLIDYLYTINCVVYGEGIKFSEEFKSEIKAEIRKRSKFGNSNGRFNVYLDYHFEISQDEIKSEENIERVRKINEKIGSLLLEMKKESSEIFEYDIYPF